MKSLLIFVLYDNHMIYDLSVETNLSMKCVFKVICLNDADQQTANNSLAWQSSFIRMSAEQFFEQTAFLDNVIVAE